MRYPHRVFDGLKAVVWPDLHAPNHYKPSVDACLKYLAYLRGRSKPDVFISLGDWCDFNSLSRFQVINAKEQVGVKAEVDSANEMLDKVDHLLPKTCFKVMTLGNHDHRPELYRLNHWDAKDSKMVDVSLRDGERIANAEKLYNLKKRGWKWVNPGETFELGKGIFTHGWYCSTHHAKKTLEKWFKTVVYGHVHDWQVYSRIGKDGHPVAGICMGTLSDPKKAAYLRGIPPNWFQMFGVFDYFKDGTFTPHLIPIIKGRFQIDNQIFK